MKPLSITLIEQIFSFMEPLGFTTYQMDLDRPAFNQLIADMKRFDHDHLIAVEVYEGDTLTFKKDGSILTFVEKCTTPQSRLSESL